MNKEIVLQMIEDTRKKCNNDLEKARYEINSAIEQFKENMQKEFDTYLNKK